MSRSIPEMARDLRSGAVSSASLAARALDDADALGPQISAFTSLDREGALEAAVQADTRLREGSDNGPLTGVPVAVKDIVDMRGMATRCGSDAYPDEPVPADATLVRLLRDAGAVIIGKTTAHELACGVYSAPASNPWALDRIPGGSSGGSAAAVAAGIVPMAVGSDTGGSIRIPASLCGVVGLKPTYGRVSRHGVEPLAWSLDHLGPLASTVEGCVAALEVMAGADRHDPTTLGLPDLDMRSTLDEGVGELRLGVLEGHPIEPMQPEVARSYAASVELLAEAGAELVPVAIPELEHTLAAEFGIVGPEAAAYHRERIQRAPELIDPDIRSLLIAGLLLPSTQYVRALRARRVISEAIRRAFEEQRLDGLLSPTLPATAAEKEQAEIDYGSMSEPVTLSYVRTTAPFNLSGLPAISVPVGFDGNGLPIGLQIAGRPYDEAMVARVGRAVEKMGLGSGQTPLAHVERSSM